MHLQKRYIHIQVLRLAMFTIFGICYLLRLRVMWIIATATSSSSNSTTMITASKSENPAAYFDMTVYFFDSFFMLILFLHFGRQKHLLYQVFKEFEFQTSSQQFPHVLYMNCSGNKKYKRVSKITVTKISVGIVGKPISSLKS